MCLAQGPQCSDTGEARTRGPSVSSQALYHWALASDHLILSQTLFYHWATYDSPVHNYFWFFKAGIKLSVYQAYLLICRRYVTVYGQCLFSRSHFHPLTIPAPWHYHSDWKYNKNWKKILRGKIGCIYCKDSDNWSWSNGVNPDQTHQASRL